MKKNLILGLIFVLALSLCFGLSSTSFAEEKKKNFRFEPTKFAAKTEGVDVQFVVFALDPGAMFKDFKVGQNEYLIVTKGEFVYTYGGKTMTKKVGDNWYHPAGTILTVTNKGNDESILLAIQGVPDKR